MASFSSSPLEPMQSSSSLSSSDLLSIPSDPEIILSRNLLIIHSIVENEGFDNFKKEFCGSIIEDTQILESTDLFGKTVYICGNLDLCQTGLLQNADRLYVIRDFSFGINSIPNAEVVDKGRAPVIVHGVGILFRRYFRPGHFDRVRAEHVFQSLTESNKPGTAHRTGIYLSDVEQKGRGDFHFNLLRCSSNLAGPTGNFGCNDRSIVNELNVDANCIFKDQAVLNHVLAQIYHNHATGRKQTKARIKEHSDKTKDMPPNSIMAFCTFYDNTDKLKPMPNDQYDLGHKGVSGLTSLHFRLKQHVADSPAGSSLVKDFRVTLYPDSVFFIPLSTNRLYTHEIEPSRLDANLMPTRMGYVVRCSERRAVHSNGTTYVVESGSNELVPLLEPDREGMSTLREFYAAENITADVVRYPPIRFSMNLGDYLAPKMMEDFRWHELPFDTCGAMFDKLLSSVTFEAVVNGRTGAVLIRPDDRGTPTVRTTTSYALPAQCFRPVHDELAQCIRRAASIPSEFNNALIEHYTNEYNKMGFHSDQAQDLLEGTHIAVYSCYKYPERTSSQRKLVIESKEDNETFEIPMLHNSVISFSLATNSKYRHKIVPSSPHPDENEWIGVTFRTAKTFVRVCEGKAYLEDGTLLRTAESAERKEFFKLRGQENRLQSFEYPYLDFTISASDTLPPVLN